MEQKKENMNILSKWFYGLQKNEDSGWSLDG